MLLVHSRNMCEGIANGGGRIEGLKQGIHEMEKDVGKNKGEEEVGKIAIGFQGEFYWENTTCQRKGWCCDQDVELSYLSAKLFLEMKEVMDMANQAHLLPVNQRVQMDQWAPTWEGGKTQHLST